MPYFGPSQPMPDSFMPPNGTISVEMMPSLMRQHVARGKPRAI
jgi:hypothetical protein